MSREHSRRRGDWRTTIARVLVVAAAAAVVAGAVLAAGRGYPAGKPRLLSGAAWLASTHVGQLTLLDGSSVEVAAQVRVATPGNALDVVQLGSSAYATERGKGSIRRVDGATFDVSPATFPIPGADDLRAFASSDALYALDSRHGILAAADPATLVNRGRPAPVGSLTGTSNGITANLDRSGRLWVLDAGTGDLTWTQDGRRRTRHNVVTPGAGILTLAGGAPVLIDPERGTVATIDQDSGAIRRTTELALGSGNRIQVSGSPQASRVYVVSNDRAVLAICDLTAAACGTAIPLDSGDLGAAVETAGKLFIPDYTNGRVLVLDLKTLRVQARADVLSPPVTFELLTRDGVVFFNDPNSERAGVIRLDGGSVRVAKVNKYDPRDPDQGLTDRNTATPPPTQPPVDTGGTASPTPSDQPSPNPSTVQISVSDDNPFVGQDVALAVVAAGPAPTATAWTFGDGQEARDPRTTHRWASAGVFQVSVRATFPGSTALASAALRVRPRPSGSLTVNVTGAGTMTSDVGGISCPPTCSANLPPGTTVTLATAPASGAGFTAWGGACAGTAGTCQVTTTAQTTGVTALFTALPRLTVRINGPSGSGTVTGGGLSCPPTCSVPVRPGTQVSLTATPGAYYIFGAWTGPCAGTGGCTVTVNAGTTVTARFNDSAAPEQCVSYNPASLQIVSLGASGYQLVSGTRQVHLLANLQDAQNALSVARGYNQYCTIGLWRFAWVEYWKGGSGRAGGVSPEDCTSYDPAKLTLTVDPSGPAWTLVSGSQNVLGPFQEQDAAVRALRVAQQHRRLCHIGRNSAPSQSYVVDYWR